MKSANRFRIRDAVTAMILLTSISVHGQDSVDARAALIEFPREYELLKQFYSNYSCDGNLTYETYDQKSGQFVPSPAVAGSLKVRDDNWLRLSFVRDDEMLLIATPDRFHLFVRSASSGKLFVRAHGSEFRPNALPEAYFFRYGGCEKGALLAALKHSEPESQILIRNVSIAQEADDELVQVETALSAAGRSEREFITYYRNRHWAVRDYLRRSTFVSDRKYVWVRKHVDYDGESNGFPIVSKLTQETGYASFGTADVNHEDVYDAEAETLVGRYILNVERFTAGPPDLTQFDNAPMLSEVGGLGHAMPWDRRAWIYGANGVLLFGLGLFFLRSKRKADQARAQVGINSRSSTVVTN